MEGVEPSAGKNGWFGIDACLLLVIGGIVRGRCWLVMSRRLGLERVGVGLFHSHLMSARAVRVEVCRGYVFFPFCLGVGGLFLSL